MKANELMLNDLVNLDYGGIAEVGKVTTIWDNDFQLLGDSAYVDDASEFCTPISLTREMLLANGFAEVYDENDPLSHHFKLDGLFILIAVFNTAPSGKHFSGQWHGMSADGHRYPRYGVFSCQYVHEMQHFLRVAGYTELADNFKIN